VPKGLYDTVDELGITFYTILTYIELGEDLSRQGTASTSLRGARTRGSDLSTKRCSKALSSIHSLRRCHGRSYKRRVSPCSNVYEI